MNRYIEVILPIYNEEQIVEKVIHEIVTYFESIEDDYKLILVNDGSTDKTEQKIKELLTDKMYYVSHVTNCGYSSALASGLRCCEFKDLILIFDSDNQFDINELNMFLAEIKEHEIVVGKRLKRADSLVRVLLGKLWSLIGRVFFGTKITDLNSGFKLYNSKLLQNLEIKTIGPGINLEIFSDENIQNVNIKELIVTHRYREQGRGTGGSSKTIILSIRDILIVMRKRLFNQ